ncbi:ferritin-like domain-containing protein [Clostridium sp. YIM B02555]|uniref:ferritin-like domain-containing protein n=1 Tax=Clostridium sp. YIM B02555 TaxID=2911968 RepID=UPI001EEDB1D9|nr:ferritin-like domain-containing protein [Clostridium sp. YIM B02555]
MSYTTNRQPQGVMNNIDGFLREGLISEMVAINDYSDFIESTDNRQIKELFHHIMLEEKRHYSIFLTLLRSLDSEERELSEEVKDHLKISQKGKYSDLTGKVLKEINLLVVIRQAIKGELEATLLYQEFVDNLTDENLIRIINEIIRDEKEHVEKLSRALIILDKDRYGDLNPSMPKKKRVDE